MTAWAAAGSCKKRGLKGHEHACRPAPAGPTPRPLLRSPHTAPPQAWSTRRHWASRPLKCWPSANGPPGGSAGRLRQPPRVRKTARRRRRRAGSGRRQRGSTTQMAHPCRPTRRGPAVRRRQRGGAGGAGGRAAARLAPGGGTKLHGLPHRCTRHAAAAGSGCVQARHPVPLSHPMPLPSCFLHPPTACRAMQCRRDLGR